MLRSFQLCGFAFLAVSLPLILGCGGGEETTVAQADPQPAAAAPASNEGSAEEQSSNSESGGESYGGESYGGESYGAEQSGGGRRGQGYGGGEEGGMEMSSYSDYSSEMNNEGMGEEGGMGMGSYGMGDMASMTGSEEGGMMGPEGYGAMGSMGAMGGNESGYGGGGYGSDYGQMMGAGGMGGGGMMGGGMNAASGPNFNALAQFVKQNCVQCHGATNPKGDLNLLTLSDNFIFDADGWSAVAEQLETGKMPPANVQRRPDPTQQAMMVSFIKEQLASSDGADEGYLARAKIFFGSGKENEAVKLLQAHTLVVDDESAASVLSQSRWFALGRKPVFTLRFAAGVILDAPSTLTDLKPIGTKQFSSGGGGGGYEGGMGMGMLGGGGNTGGGTEKSFYDLTGDLGQSLASGFQSRWASGSLGSVFNEVAEVDSNVTTVATAGGAGGGGYGQMMGGEMGGMGGGMGPPALGGGEFGGYGGGYGGESGGMEQGGRPAGPRKTIRAGQSITPGLVFLGTGSQQELMEKAAEAGIDGVFLFDVEVTRNRRGIINNETRIRLVMTSGDVVASTKTLINTEVERAAMRGTDDEVEKNIERMFARMDTEVQLTAMPPQLKSEHAKKRIHQLVNDKTIGPLETMYETRLFNSLGLISQEDMATVFQILLRGNEGLVLATGSPQDRKLVMKEILAK